MNKTRVSYRMLVLAFLNIITLSGLFLPLAYAEDDQAAQPASSSTGSSSQSAGGSSMAVESGLDMRVAAVGRTYAPALSVNPSIGYGQKLWGDTQTPLYGFIRPYMIGVVSPALYEGKVGLEVFPISILGADVRRTWGRRFINTKGQNCDQVECQGLLGYTEASLQMFLGYKQTFASVRFTKTNFDAIDSRTKPIFDIASSILLNPDGDRGDYLSVVLGQKLDGVRDGLSGGVMAQSNQFNGTSHRMEAAYLFGRLDRPFKDVADSSILVGVGAFRSNQSVTEVSLLAAVVYTPRKALGLGR